MQRHDLPVDIAQAHGIVIHQRQASHPRAAQRLGARAAHAAQAEHRHARILQPRHAFIAQQQRRALAKIMR